MEAAQESHKGVLINIISLKILKYKLLLTLPLASCSIAQSSLVVLSEHMIIHVSGMNYEPTAVTHHKNELTIKN